MVRPGKLVILCSFCLVGRATYVLYVENGFLLRHICMYSSQFVIIVVYFSR